MSAAVSVLCPTYNRSAAIGRTLASVLAQEHVDVELLVGSDGSTDDTEDVVRALAAHDDRVRLVRMPHRGDPGPVRADLARRARHGVVAYVDHDDEWRPDHLRAALAGLDGYDAVVLAGTYRSADGTLTRSPAVPWHAEVGVLDPYAEPTRVVHRRSALDVAGGWRRGRRGLEDWDLWWRMAAAGVAFRPLGETTSTVALDPSSRRWSVPSHPLVVLAVASDERAARDAVGRWADEPSPTLDLLDEQGRRWADALARDPRTIGASSDGPGSLRRTWLALPQVHPGGAAGWLVALAAPIVSPVHRRRAGALLAHRFPDYLAASRTWFADQPGLSPVKELDR